jgi:hypothetical protein
MAIAVTSCNKVRRSPGRAYMPDMYYSRAYETYTSTENLKKSGANYTAMPGFRSDSAGRSVSLYFTKRFCRLCPVSFCKKSIT